MICISDYISNSLKNNKIYLILNNRMMLHFSNRMNNLSWIQSHWSICNRFTILGQHCTNCNRTSFTIILNCIKYFEWTITLGETNASFNRSKYFWVTLWSYFFHFKAYIGSHNSKNVIYLESHRNVPKNVAKYLQLLDEGKEITYLVFPESVLLVSWAMITHTY